MRTSDEDLFEGQVIEKYTVLGVLGQGGMATVYKVRHNLLGTIHALKVLHQSRPSVRRRLMLEGQVQARLRHNHIVAVTDVLELDAGIGLVLEFVEGTDLETLVDNKRLSLEQLDALADGIFRGVEYAHQHGLVHRDLKPANVLLKVEGRQLVPKVADFGLVKDESELSATRSGMAMGTPRYMAPEQIRDAKSADQRSDVFSLGALLYAMVTNREAFCPDGDDIVQVFMAIYSGAYIPVQSLRPDAPDRIAAAIDIALRVDPQERHPSVEAFRACWYEQSEDGALWDLDSLTGERSTEITESLPELVAPSNVGAHVSDQTLAMLTPPPVDRRDPPEQAPAPSSTLLPPEPSTKRPRSLLVAMAAVGVLLVLLSLGIAAGTAAMTVATVEEPTPAVEEPVEEVLVAEVPVEEDPEEPVEEPAVGEDEVDEPEVEPVAAPTPRPTPAPRKPVAPTPKPVARPAPAPKPVATTPVTPTHARFSASGGRAYLRSGGVDHPPGRVEPGRYDVHASVDGVSVDVGSVTVGAGEEVVVTCKPMLKLCDAEVRR